MSELRKSTTRCAARAAIAAALETLSRRELLICVLAADAGLSDAEAAAVLGCSVVAYRRRHRMAVARVRAAISPTIGDA
jgi:DNA-directed RNA polymerase specialized sigma24 family protein